MVAELQFFDKLKILREITTHHKNAPSAIGEIKYLLCDDDVRREFFQTLENSDWIMPLRENGYFDNPTKAERLEDGTRFPQWPPSKYLSRMAKYAPAEIAAIFTDLRTDNASIIGDMIEAALAMPIDDAATLVPSICQAIRKDILWMYFKEASALCVYLATGDKVTEATILAEALFTPTFSEGQDELNQMDEHCYKEGLKKIVPLLADRAPQIFLPMLCDWLGAFVQVMKSVDLDSGSDYSSIWRPAIEEHEQNRDYEFTGKMVSFIRGGFEKAIQEKKISLDKALEIIGQYKYLIFKRICIHLINKFAEDNSELVRQTIMDPGLFGDYHCKHEYAMLVGRRLKTLSAEEQKQWFGWIDAGPDMSNYDETFRKNHGRDASEEDRRGRVRYWQFEKLHLVRNHLDTVRQTFYDEMLNKHGEPELADLNFRSGLTQWGHENESPISVDELTKISFDEAVAKVSSWQPEEPNPMSPQIEGLAATFRQYVGTNSSTFSKRANILIECPVSRQRISSSCHIGCRNLSIKYFGFSPAIALQTFSINRQTSSLAHCQFLPSNISSS